MNQSTNARPDANYPAQLVVPADESEIRQLAAKIWAEVGRPEGRDSQIWLEAEAKLQSESSTRAETPDFECSGFPALW